MKPLHATMASAIANISITGDSNKLLAVGALGFAAGIMASSKIPQDSDLIFDAFTKKVEGLTADKTSPDILITLTETIGTYVNPHIGDMTEGDLPTATFLKTTLDSLRDDVAHLVPDAMHMIQHAVYAATTLKDHIDKLSPPAMPVVEASAELGSQQRSQLAEDLGGQGDDDVDPAIAAANQDGVERQATIAA